MADQEEKVEEQEETTEEASTEEKPEAEAAPEPEAAAEASEPAAEAGAAEPVADAEPEPEPEAEPEAVATDAAESEPAAEPEPAPEAAAEAEPEAEAPGEPSPQEELSYEVLHKKTVAELRDIAQGIEHEALQGYSTMHKEHLVPALCTALGIEAHAHHEVVGINKDRVKAKIRTLKLDRQAALEAGDHDQLKLVRRRIKSLKRKIRRATV